jgi:hypothetical protein
MILLKRNEEGKTKILNRFSRIKIEREPSDFWNYVLSFSDNLIIFDILRGVPGIDPKGLSLLSQKLEENFSLNYSLSQSLRQEIKSNIMKENGPDWGEEKEGRC